jgi:hypothetical protein
MTKRKRTKAQTTIYKTLYRLEKKYAPTLDNYGQSCFVRSDLKKMKCVCKTQMMPPLNIKILWTCTPPLCV